MITRDRIKKLIDEGKTEDEVVALKPMAEFDKEWGAWFINPERFLWLSYKSLK